MQIRPLLLLGVLGDLCGKIPFRTCFEIAFQGGFELFALPNGRVWVCTLHLFQNTIKGEWWL